MFKCWQILGIGGDPRRMRSKNICEMSLNEVDDGQHISKQPLKMEECKRDSIDRVPSFSETDGITLDWSTFNHINHDVLKLKTSLLKLKRIMQEDMGTENRRDSLYKDYMADVLNVMERDLNSNSQYTSLIASESQYTSLIAVETEQLAAAASAARISKSNLPNDVATAAAPAQGTEPLAETKLIAFEENQDLKRELILLHQKLEEKDRKIKNLENLLSIRNCDEPPSIHSVPNTPSMATVNRATQTKRVRPASCGRNLSRTVINNDNQGGFTSLTSDSPHIVKPTPNPPHQEPRKPFRNSSPIHSRISRHKKRQVDEASKSVLPASSAKLLGFNKRINDKDRGRSPSGGRHTAKRAESPRISEKSLISHVNSTSVLDRPLLQTRLRGDPSQTVGQEDGSSGSEISNASYSEASVSTHSDISKSNTSIASSIGLSHLRKVSAPSRGSALRDKYLPRKLP